MQKSVVILATLPILGSVRSKLGMVTQALFAQRDFSQLDILQVLYENLNSASRAPFNDSAFFSGISLREIVIRFRRSTLQIFKLLLLGKRVLFFGHKVERLSAYQYGFISMVPQLQMHLEDVGSPLLENPAPQSIEPEMTDDEKGSRRASIALYKSKMLQLGHPLCLFGKGAFFQPYVPLQQMDVLTSPDTKSFLVGSSNAIFIKHKACAIDVVVNIDTGLLDIQDKSLVPLLTLTPADSKFIDALIKPVSTNWTPENDMSQNQQIEYEGSDDDIRAHFEVYLTQLLCSVEAVAPPAGADGVGMFILTQ